MVHGSDGKGQYSGHIREKKELLFLSRAECRLQEFLKEGLSRHVARRRTWLWNYRTEVKSWSYICRPWIIYLTAI